MLETKPSHPIRRKTIRATLLFALVAATAAIPASAIRHLTVAQLEKTLASDVAHHHADGDMVRQFADFDLTERLTDATRTHIAEQLHLGPQTTLALQLMADDSALLDPPQAELPTDPAPDQAAAKHMLDAATTWVAGTLPHLPDFLATRTTYTFNDTPQVLKENEWPVPAGLHMVGKNSQEITFRDDHEVTDPAPAMKNASAPGAPARPRERGLQSFGEFGQLLGVILIDSDKGTIAFHHWEKTSAGILAVYHYSVPKAQSHYTVSYCCMSDSLRTNTRGGGRRGGGATGAVAGAPTTLFHMIPAYHGSLFIEPSTGIVRRVTLDAEMGDSKVSRAGVVIEYGPVTIGDGKYICPVRSMNVYKGPPETGPLPSELQSSVTEALLPTGTLYINETSFSNYHRLGSTVRILTDAEAQSATHP